MEPLLTSTKEGWTQPQKILALLLLVSLLMNIGTLAIVAVVGAHIFDVTSAESLCNTATSCLAKANLQFVDALVATLWTPGPGAASLETSRSSPSSSKR